MQNERNAVDMQAVDMVRGWWWDIADHVDSAPTEAEFMQGYEQAVQILENTYFNPR
jgi:hypothetical protein